MNSLSVVVFGDGTNNVSGLLPSLLLQASHSVSQAEFIRHVGIALEARLHRLNPYQRKSIPDFKDVHDLATIYQERKGVCHPAISSALLCVTQLLQIFR
jgi:hypothetical protein